MRAPVTLSGAVDCDSLKYRWRIIAMNLRSGIMRSLKMLISVSLALVPIGGLGAAWESSAAAKSFRKGDLQAVKRIIKSDKEGYESPRIILEALPTAIASGNLDLIKYLDSLGWLDICRNTEHCLLIHNAAEYGHVAVMRYLVSRGFDVHTVTAPTLAGGGGKNNAMHLAAYRGHLAAVKFLCSQGVDANARNEYGHTPLEEARMASFAGSLARSAKEDARIRANLAEVIKYLESGQCRKK